MVFPVEKDATRRERRCWLTEDHGYAAYACFFARRGCCGFFVRRVGPSCLQRTTLHSHPVVPFIPSTRILFLVSNPYLDYVFLNQKNPQTFPQKLSITIQKSSKLSILDPTFGTFGSVQGEKFAFWPDGGCLIAGTDSQRVIAEDYEVISGRRAPWKFWLGVGSNFLFLGGQIYWA